MVHSLHNRTLWLIGATSGIGLPLAHYLAARGVNLLLSARKNERLEKLCASCREVGATAQSLSFDLLEQRACRRAVELALRYSGGIDIVIILAGLSQRATALETLPEVRRQIFMVNLEAPISITEQLLPYLRQRPESQLVIVGSLASYISTPWRSAYCAAKHAVRSYFETLSLELRGRPYVTVVTPGFIHTNISRHALKGDGKPYGQMDRNQLRGIPAQRCARKIAQVLIHRRPELFVGLQFKGWLILLIRALIPALYRRLIATQ